MIGRFLMPLSLLTGLGGLEATNPVITTEAEIVPAGCVGCTLYSSAMPPERFRGDTQHPVWLMLVADPNTVCRQKVPEGMQLLACTQTLFDGSKLLVLHNSCLETVPVPSERITCHELGHANGWSRWHEL